MKILKTFALCAICALSACATDNYNIGETAKTKDVNEKSEYVYGDGKGKPARQTKNTYPDPADAQARADKVREKFFGVTVSAETGVAKDSTKKEEKKEEAKDTKDAKKK